MFNFLEINQKNPWKQFWLNVENNNQTLRNYCESGLYDEVLKIITEGKNGYPAEVNSKGLDDWRPLHFCSYEGYDDVAELLIKHGADVNAYTRFNRNALHIASIRGFL